MWLGHETEIRTAAKVEFVPVFTLTATAAVGPSPRTSAFAAKNKTNDIRLKVLWDWE
jgi:hypothetical protein